MTSTYTVTLDAERGRYLEDTGRALDVPITYRGGRAYLSQRALAALSQMDPDCDGHVEAWPGRGLRLWIGGTDYPVVDETSTR